MINMTKIYKKFEIMGLIILAGILLGVNFLPRSIFIPHSNLDNNIGICPEMNGLAYTEIGDDRQAYLLQDGNYLVADVQQIDLPFMKFIYISIVKTDSNNTIHLYNLNIRLTERSKFASRNNQYIEIHPFQSDYIENNISTEQVEPNTLNAVQNFYFLHVENGYGVIFQKPLKIPYTENRKELVVKIHEAALQAGYITE